MAEQIKLWVLVLNHYSAKLPATRRSRRVSAVRQTTTQPPWSGLAIYSHNSKTWRVADAGAWLEDDEDSFSIDVGPSDRGRDIERKCAEILNARNEVKS